MSDWVEEGETAPDFTLPADDGRQVKLVRPPRQARGALLLSQGRHARLHQGGVRLPRPPADLKERAPWCSASRPDDVASHGEFRDKYGLNFPLLADADHQVAESYGAWREKNMYGKVSMGIQRSTFLIDARRARSRKVVEEGQRRRPRRAGARRPGIAVARRPGRGGEGSPPSYTTPAFGRPRGPVRPPTGPSQGSSRQERDVRWISSSRWWRWATSGCSSAPIRTSA